MKSHASHLSVAVAIPTYRREAVLIDTINHVLAQEPPADEVIVVDQTEKHLPGTTRFLEEASSSGRIRWISHHPPNLPGARNRALAETRSDITIFIDDDVVLRPGFIRNHLNNFANPEVLVVAGSVTSSEAPSLVDVPTPDTFLEFPFNSQRQNRIHGIRGCNFSVRSEFARSVGGFDERYIQNAYREESDFAVRAILRSNKLIAYDPSASLIHLTEPNGGCRSNGASVNPREIGRPLGDYYFTFQNLPFKAALIRIVARQLGTDRKRYTLTHPWMIPLLQAREFVAASMALYGVIQGRKLGRFKL